MANRTYGEIPGYPVGSTFVNRTDLAASGVHRPLQAGISGGKDGADSIVVSGGYIDDEDHGDEIIYTGQGGNHPVTKRQIADQTLTRGNVGLARSQLEGLPIRVIRGAHRGSIHAPAEGLRYDGLFRVVDHWPQPGLDGYRIYRFRLVTLESSDPPPPPPPSAPTQASRAEAVIQRIIRSTQVAKSVKELHEYKCQICGVCLMTPAGPYAESAHIRGLGRPHNGPDVSENVLCLCPNHHVLFDTGALVIDAEGTVRDTLTGDAVGQLHLDVSHKVDWAYVDYHHETHIR